MTIEYLRSFRIVGYAVFDLSLAFVGVYLLAPWLSKMFLKVGVIIPRVSWMLLTLPIGILTHMIFGTDTLMVRNILNPSDHYALKILVLALTLLALMKIKLR